MSLTQYYQSLNLANTIPQCDIACRTDCFNKFSGDAENNDKCFDECGCETYQSTLEKAFESQAKCIEAEGAECNQVCEALIAITGTDVVDCQKEEEKVEEVEQTENEEIGEEQESQEESDEAPEESEQENEVDEETIQLEQEVEDQEVADDQDRVEDQEVSENEEVAQDEEIEDQQEAEELTESNDENEVIEEGSTLVQEEATEEQETLEEQEASDEEEQEDAEGSEDEISVFDSLPTAPVSQISPFDIDEAVDNEVKSNEEATEEVPSTDSQQLFLQEPEQMQSEAKPDVQPENMSGWLTVSTGLSFAIFGSLVYVLTRKEKQGVTLFTPYEEWERY